MAVGAMITAATGVVPGALVGFVLLGLGKPSFDAAAQAYVADRTPFERRARYLSILELTWAGGMLIGAPLIGLLIAGYGWRAPFWVLSAMFVVAAVIAPRISMPTPRDRRRRESRCDPTAMFALLAAGFLFSFAAETTFVVFGAWMEDGFALSLAALGIASTAIAVAELVGEGSVLIYADRLGAPHGGSGSGDIGGRLRRPRVCLRHPCWWPCRAGVDLHRLRDHDRRHHSAGYRGGTRGAGTLPGSSWSPSGSDAAGDAVGPSLYTWKGIPATATVSAVAAFALSLMVILALVPERARVDSFIPRFRGLMPA